MRLPQGFGPGSLKPPKKTNASVTRTGSTRAESFTGGSSSEDHCAG